MATMRDSIWQCSEEIARRATGADFALQVPSCPDWTLGDLVFHLGSVQSFWASQLLARSSSSPLETEEQGADQPDDVLVEWFRECTRSLLDALREVGNESPCWTWWGAPATSGAVGRHQVQEAAIHSWDAQLATGEPKPIATEIALDGVSEFLEVHQSQAAVAAGEAVLLRASDSGATWRVGDGPAAAEVTASTSQLVLLLHRRIPLSSATISGGEGCVRSLLDSANLL